MGRIADALARAEQERGTAVESRVSAVTESTKKWFDWDGSVQPHPHDITDAPDVPQKSDVSIEGMAEEIVSYLDRSSLVSEQYRSLRTRLLSTNPRQQRRLYLISSAVPKDGKSITTINLAFSLAEIRHLRILMVDADFRHSSMAGVLRVDRQPGLADHLRGEASFEDIIRPTPLPNLFFVAAGRTGGRSAPELLSTNASKAAFKRFEKEFHYTLIDTPPVTTVADVGIIGPLVSGVIFVVRMHHTPEPMARHAVKVLASNNIPVVGSLVIGEDDPSTGYGSRYNYYRYYYNDDSGDEH
jgi:capsular exopolysaccharide synthesis family protein